MKGDDKAAIEAATEKLSEASSALAQKMYAEQSAQQQAPGADADDGQKSGGSDDNVVDAEFEEVKNDK